MFAKGLSLFMAAFAATCLGQSLGLSKINPFAIGSAQLSAVTYGEGRFVAAGENALIYSENGGENWREGVGFFRTKYNSVAFGFGMFLAVGETNIYSKSEEGVGWGSSSGIVPYGTKFKGVLFGENEFIAYGTNEKFPPHDVVYRTPRGEDWYLISSNKVSLLIFGGGRYLGVSEGKQLVSYVSGGPWELFEANIPQWIDSGCSASGCREFVRFEGLAYHRDQFVATVAWARAGVDGSGSRGSVLAVSSDGRNWQYTPVNFPASAPSEKNDLFKLGEILYRVQRTDDPSGTAILSFMMLLDGNVFETEAFAGDIQDMVYGDTNLVAVSKENGGIIYGKPGEGPWTEAKWPDERLVSAASSTIVNVAVGNFSYGSPAGSASPTIICWSNSQPRFENINPPLGCGALAKVRYGNGKFVAVGAIGSIIVSSDGRIWEKRISNTMVDFFDVAYGDGLWVAVGVAGRVVSSTDGVRFTLRSSGTELDLHGVAFGGGQFVAAGKEGIILQSTNGIDWAPMDSPRVADLWGITYGNGRFVAAGTNGLVLISTNASSWIPRVIGANPGMLSSVAFADRYFVATEFGTNRFYASRDGLTWVTNKLIWGYSFSADSLAGCGIGGGSLFGAVGTFWLTGDHSAIWKASWTADPRLTLLVAPTENRGSLITLIGTNRNDRLGWDSGTYDLYVSKSVSQPQWTRLESFVNAELPVSREFPGTNLFFRSYSNAFFRVIKRLQ